MYDLIIRDATIVSSTGRSVADVALKGGLIAYVGPRPPRRAKEELSAMGKFMMPGVIDTAVQFDPNGDSGFWERESRAAVTGGVTSVLALPGGDHPVIDTATAKRRAKNANHGSWTNWALWGAANGNNAAELDVAHRDGLIIAALAYLGERADGISMNSNKLDNYLAFAGTVGVQLDFNESTAAEPVGARELLEAAQAIRPIHLVHLSTAAELNLLDPVRGALPVTAGCTPHHLFLTNDETPIHTSPPVRGERDRRTLWAAVKRGRLDCVASDHHPYDETANGVPGTELMFPLMLSAVRYGRLSLELLVSLCSESPARIFGLENKGRIAKGMDADLVLFSEGEISRVQPGSLKSTAGWSPYTDREAAPKPELVFVNGQLVARRGELVANKPSGTCLTAQA
ncbi:MAG: amidohydrolase family protein [Rhodobacterales bacterium]|nr:amidohydrolase family protein [Rhodobacterales bacterium]